MEIVILGRKVNTKEIGDFVDENGVVHVDGFKTNVDEGSCLGYIVNGDFYPTNPDHMANKEIQESVNNFIKSNNNGK